MDNLHENQQKSDPVDDLVQDVFTELPEAKSEDLVRGRVDDLIQDVFSEPPVQVDKPVKVFKPWHKPRKQLIRLFQWKEEIYKLIKEINLDGRPLRYISLPGEDFLDIRVIYELCEVMELKLRFLGFNDAVELDDNNQITDPAYNEIVNLKWIDERSQLAPDRFETIYNTETMASKYVNDLGSFDVLNLDLCDSVANKKQHKSSYQTYYDAIMRLIQQQTTVRAEPWLLFLTTRCTPNGMNGEDLQKFWQCIDNNIKSNQDFRNEFFILIKEEYWDKMTLLGDTNTVPPLEFTNTFCIGLGKWLLQIMLTGIPKWKVTMLPSYFYRVNSPYDMLSVAFRFDPLTVPPYDHSGLSKFLSPASEGSEKEFNFAIDLIKVTSKTSDIDQILKNDTELNRTIIEINGGLLKRAGYPMEDYYPWLDKYNLL